MISVSKTVIHEYTMVVKFLDASIAKVAVVCILGPKCFAGHAHIVEVVVFCDELFKQPQEIGLSGHIARVYKSQNIEKHSREEKESGHD